MTFAQPSPWILAARPKTLFAAVSPVLLGTAVAIFDGGFRLGPALAALIAATLIQIGTNLANDVADFRRGADSSERLGPVRVTQAGLLSPAQVTLGMLVSFLLAAGLGIYLFLEAGWPVLIIGLASILAGVTYTGGPLPFGYFGLGDLIVFIFFGPVAVIGTYYVQALSVTQSAIWASIPVGLFATAILVVNNLRDIDTDRASGKITLAVRIGSRKTRLEYAALILLAYAAVLGAWWVRIFPVGVLLAFLSFPLGIQAIRAIYRQTGRALNQSLARTSQLELIFAILYSIGILLQR